MSEELYGKSGVGKTSLFIQYCENKFEQSLLSTVGLDFHIKYFEFEGKKAKVTITDTSGQEMFDSLNTNYLKKANGAIVVYDLTDFESFKLLNKWVKSLKENAEDCNIIILGNKCDLDIKRQVCMQDAKSYADQLDAPFYEVSALSNINVKESFEKIIMDTFKSIVDKDLHRKSFRIKNTKQSSNNKSKNKCC